MQRMSSWEFAAWDSYYQREPFGYHAEMYRMGVIASTITNTVPRKPGTKPLKPSDFYPQNRHTRDRVDLTPSQRAFIERKHANRRNSNR